MLTSSINTTSGAYEGDDPLNSDGDGEADEGLSCQVQQVKQAQRVSGSSFR